MRSKPASVSTKPIVVAMAVLGFLLLQGAPSTPTRTIHAQAGTTNLARLPEAWAEQSSSYRDRMAMRAVDGSTNGNWNGGQLASTHATPNAWWEIDLGAASFIDEVRLWNGMGGGGRGGGPSLGNFHVLVSDLPIDSQRLDEALAQTGVDSWYQSGAADFPSTISINRSGRYLRIQLAGNGYLTMAEAEVYGRRLPVIHRFTTPKGNVAAGQSATLEWRVDGTSQITLSGGDLGLNGIDVSGQTSHPLTPGATAGYRLEASNGTDIVLESVTIGVDEPIFDLYISEFLASNVGGIRDQDGDRSDWIEISNPNAYPVSLAGWGLSNDPAEPFRYSLPDAQVPGGGRLVVWASGKERFGLAPGAEVHADFRLASNGEYLALTRPDGQAASEFAPAFPPQRADISYGLDAGGDLAFFWPPSPSAPNLTIEFDGFVAAKPNFSAERGLHDTPFALTLSTDEPGASIRYTLDGTKPSSTIGLDYVDSIQVSDSALVRAAAIKPGFVDSPVESRSYIFLDAVINAVEMDEDVTRHPVYGPQMVDALRALPSISLAVPMGEGVDRFEQEISMEYFDPLAHAGQPSQFQLDAGLFRFGGYFSPPPKVSMRLRFRGKYGSPKLHFPLFEGFDRGLEAVTAFDQLDLHSGSQDVRRDAGFYLSNAFVDDLLLNMGSLGSHGRFVHLYLNGQYWGQYHLRERFDADFLASYLGGQKTDYEGMNGNQGSWSTWYAPHPSYGRAETWGQVVAQAGDYERVKNILDVPNFINYMLAWYYGGHEYEFRGAGSRGPGTGYKFQHNDADYWLSMDAVQQNFDKVGDPGPEDIFGKLLAQSHPDFRMLLTDLAHKAYFADDGTLTQANNRKRLDARVEEIELSFLAESARWGNLSPELWQSKKDSAYNQIFPVRTQTVMGQLRNAGFYPRFGPPVIGPKAGQVPSGTQPTMTATTGSILFTADGSDPRAPGGAVGNTALPWTPGDINLEQDTLVRARAWTGSSWSALAESQFLVGDPVDPSAQNLLVSEVFYHPYLDDEHDFIELWNSSNDRIDLSGARIEGAVDFTFPGGTTLPAGAFVMVAQDKRAFTFRYQNPGSAWFQPDLTLAGEWSSSLSNNGEEVVVVDAAGAEVLRFEYGDGGAWPGRADGKGSSLELEAPDTAPDSQPERDDFLGDAGNWRPSSEIHGSPGRFGLGPDNRVVINEVLANSEAPALDAIELFNRSGTPMDLSGWFLSDSASPLEKYRFPQGSTLVDQGYLALDESDFNDPLAPFSLSPFALSGAYGDDLYLVSADSAGKLLRFVDTVSFGPSASGEAFGRWPEGTGRLHPMRQPSLGNPNDASGNLPRVGPLVISEIHYNPSGPDAGLEYIEVYNSGQSTQSLDDWRIRGDVDFDVGAGLSLAPDQALILVDFDPNDPDPAPIDAFRAAWDESPTAQILGPWTDGGTPGGQLDNGGTNVRLQRPDALFDAGDGSTPFHPMLMEDTAIYDDDAPWPETPDGDGPSLERLDLQGVGDLPESWRASPYLGGTPGYIPARGDTSCDYVRSEIDALFILQHDVGQRAAAASCPLDTDTLLEPGCDINGDGRCDVLDALQILQCEKGVPNPLCTQGVWVEPAETASARVQLAGAALAPGQTLTIPITMDVTGELQAAGIRLDLLFDPRVVTITDCALAPDQVGYCRIAPAGEIAESPELARIQLSTAAPEGFEPSTVLALLTFQAADPFGATSPTVLHFNDLVGVDVENGEMEMLPFGGLMRAAGRTVYLPYAVTAGVEP